MKRFAITILTVAVFFVGLGALVDNVGAKFKSDERALDLVRKARLAIGGDAAINAVQSMRVVGQTNRTMKVNGVDSTDQGETEIAFQFPDKLIKMVKIGHADGTGVTEQRIDKQVNVIVTGDAKTAGNVTVDASGNGEGAGAIRKIVIRKDDGTVQEISGDQVGKFVVEDHAGPGEPHTIILKKKADGTIEQVNGEAGPRVFVSKADGAAGPTTFTSKDGKTFNVETKSVVMDHGAGGARDNELLRTTLSLLLTAPQGMDVSYTFGGESNVDGTDCNIVVAEFAGSSYKIFLGKSSNLPVMMSYTAAKMPMMFARTIAPKTGEEPKGNVMFARTISDGAGPMAEYSVKFSDYRAVNGVQLPYKWTRSVGGAIDEVFDVTNYEINPANIGDKFQNNNVKVRLAKPVIDNK